TPTLPHKGGGSSLFLPPPLWGRVGVGGTSRTGDDDDFIADDEAGEQTDAELPDEVAGTFPELGVLGALSDGGEEAMNLFLGQTDTVVGEHERRRLLAAGFTQHFKRDFALVRRFEMLP